MNKFKDESPRARIGVVFHKDPLAPPNSIDIIRLREITSGLIKSGYDARILARIERKTMIEDFIPVEPLEELSVDGAYDLVKTCYHFSIKLIGEFKGPVVSRIVRVVDEKWPKRDETFRGELLECQAIIKERSDIVAMNNDVNRQRWRQLYGDDPGIVLVPTGCPETIPEPGPNPYEHRSVNIIFLGSLSADRMVQVINELAKRLAHKANIHLIGKNKASMYGCDQHCALISNIIDHGEIEQDRIWDYLRYADIGLAIATNSQPFDNDVSKVLNYLRAGLPTLSEEPILNNQLIRQTGLGATFMFGDMNDMESKALELLNCKNLPPRSETMAYMAERHSWTQRVQTYADLFPKLLNE